MPYEPLHHKYRPQIFADLVGQEAITTTLTNAIQRQRIAPAYLFTGPRGTGKTSSARILARSLNCLSHKQPTETPCGQCQACITIARGDALDVIEIDAASNTGVDNIRDLIEKAQFAPVQCRYKVYVIDECHMLSTAAFNALLKTLEEPPDRIVFVLATTDPQRVLPTIISRCQRFDFRRIPLDAMVEHLSSIAAQEQIDILNPAITLVAQLSQGGLRDAESLLDQLSLLPPPITPEAVWDLVGAVPERDLLSLVQALVRNDPETVIDQARQLMNRGREPLIVLQNLASFYRDLLIAKTAPQRGDMVAITEDTWQEMCQLATTLDLGLLLQSQQQLRASETQLKNTTQPRLWLEVTLMGLLPAAVVPAPVATQPVGFVPRQDDRSTLTAPGPTPLGTILEAPVSQPTSITPDPRRLDPPNPTPATPEPYDAQTDPPLTTPHSDHHALWERTLARTSMASVKALFRQQAQLLSLQGSQAIVAIRPKLITLAETKIAPIQEALSQVLGYPVTIKLQPSETLTQASPPTSPPPTRPTYGSQGESSPAITVSHPSVVTETPPPSPQPTPPPTPRPPSPGPDLTASERSLPTPAPNNFNPAPSLAPPWQQDQVLQAAKSLAQFFNGDVVLEEDDQPES